MSDFDKLKRGAPNEDRVEAVYQVKEEKQINVKKPNLFSLLMATIKRDKAYLESVNDTKVLPSFSYSFLSLIIAVSLAVILVICYFSMDLVKFLPLFMLFGSFAIPVIILVFYFEMNHSRSLNLFSVFVTIAFGFVLFLVTALVKRALLNTLSFYVDVDLYITPFLFVSLIFVSTFILANVFKSTSLPECFIIATTLAMTYFSVSTITGIFEDMFINVRKEIVIENYVYPSVNAIIKDSDYLAKSVENIFENWFTKFIYTPVMYSCWAVIIGAVVSMTSKMRNKNGNVPKTLYLLLLLDVLFYYIAFVNTSVELFDIILKFMSFFGSAYLAVKFINMYISN